MTEPAAWASRIVEQAEVSPLDIVGNPRNWRLHSSFQQSAVAQALDRVGWVAPVIVNRRSGHLVDGHLRVALAVSRDEPTIPVSYVDLDEDEERLVLATLDPLGELAGVDEPALTGLVSALEVELDAALDKMLADLTGREGDAPAAVTGEDVDAATAAQETQFETEPPNMLTVTCPGCGQDFAINLDELDPRNSPTEQAKALSPAGASE